MISCTYKKKSGKSTKVEPNVNNSGFYSAMFYLWNKYSLSEILNSLRHLTTCTYGKKSEKFKVDENETKCTELNFLFTNVLSVM